METAVLSSKPSIIYHTMHLLDFFPVSTALSLMGTSVFLQSRAHYTQHSVIWFRGSRPSPSQPMSLCPSPARQAHPSGTAEKLSLPSFTGFLGGGSSSFLMALSLRDYLQEERAFGNEASIEEHSWLLCPVLHTLLVQSPKARGCWCQGHLGFLSFETERVLIII